MSGITCKALGYTCTMKDCLDVETVPVYRYEQRLMWGTDDVYDFVPVGNPIGFELEYTAYRKCSHCGKIVHIGTSKKVPLGTVLSFEDFVTAENKRVAYEKALAEFDKKQAKEREQFIQQNKPTL